MLWGAKLLKNLPQKGYAGEAITGSLALNLVLFSGIASAAEPAVYAQAGDVSANSAVVWARCNAEIDGRLSVDLTTDAAFGPPGGCSAERCSQAGSAISAASDYTAAVLFTGLQAQQTYYYRARCPAKANEAEAVAATGRFRTAPDSQRPALVRFVWLADLAGQGWGRNPELEIRDNAGEVIRGGYVSFAVIDKLKPDFAVLAGDIIYADNPIHPQKPIPSEAGGGTWLNQPAKDFVAITLDQYRANWRYNLGDEKLRSFLLHTPVYVQWDDHEVSNNWYPGEILKEPPYSGMAADELAARARQALFEYNPIAGSSIYRRFRYGKQLELFLLDERSLRGPNSDNRNPGGIEMLGQQQFQWLKESLKQSEATWKVISTHDPLSLVTGSPSDHDGWTQGDPQVLGRELQLSELLKFIRDERIKNVVFITADVHFAAAISYDPARARWPDFAPFWEFAIGPVHAGAFGAAALDDSFGARFEYVRAPSTSGSQNLPPPQLQSFGEVEISEGGDMHLRLRDYRGRSV
jgi:alkaline phosphatase D